MRKLHFFSILVALSLATTNLWATPPAANGQLTCKFSVSGSTQVYFAQGNLQYNSDNQKWQFASEQYEYIGTGAGNTSVTVDGKANNTGITDLFGWVGASSIWTGLKQYGITSSGAGNAVNGYGNNGSEALKIDWGRLAITNGGNTSNSGWRTLTKDEWVYLLDTRTGNKASTIGTTTNVRYAKGQIDSYCGLFLFPDGVTFATSEFTSVNNLNTTNKSFNVGVRCTLAQWRALEEKGCVFLPAAGIRVNYSYIKVDNVGTSGSYWSSSPAVSNDPNYANEMGFDGTRLFSSVSSIRYYHRAVRLVKVTSDAIKTASVTTAPSPKANLTYTGSAQALVNGGVAQGGTMMYRKGTSGSYSTTIPTETNVGTYRVYYYAEGIGCFNNSTATFVDVTIAKADYTPSGTYSVSGNSLSYNGSTQALVSVTGSVSDGTIWYKLGDSDWTTEIPSASAMGDYHVWYKVVPSNSNYKDTEPVEVLASITIPTVTDNSDAATINAVLALNPTALKVERTIYADGEYNTICLPFAVSASELTTSTHPLYGYERLKAFKGAKVSGSGQDLSIDIFVEDVDHMDAGVPYLITYPAGNADIVNPVFTDITVTETTPGSVSADGVTFQGMFAQVHIDPYTEETRAYDYLFLGANSQLNWPLASETSSDVKMRGFRAYFIIDRTVITPAQAPAGTRARFVNAPKQPTSIENTELNTQAQKLLENGQLIILKNGIKYNAQGQVLK